jgi:hypothetical protein
LPLKRPETTSSIDAEPLGDVGDDPPQPENQVASVAPDATRQAPAQKRRRETQVPASDIAVIQGERPMAEGQYQGHAKRSRFFRGYDVCVVCADHRRRISTGDLVSAHLHQFC